MAAVENTENENVEVVQLALAAYGQAMRNDWGDIDGGDVQNDLGYLSTLLNPDAPTTTLEEALEQVGVRVDDVWGYVWAF